MGAVYVSVVVVMLFNFNKNPFKKWKKQRGEVYNNMFNYKKNKVLGLCVTFYIIFTKHQ